MTFNSTRSSACAVLLYLGTFAATAQAGTIRHDTDDSLYTNLATSSTYEMVGELIIDNDSDLGNGYGLCSGTLLSSTIVLTAAHCVNGSISTMSFSLEGINSGSAVSYAFESYAYHAGFDDTDLLAGDDIAIVELAAEITGVSFAQLYTGSGELGSVGTSVGFGLTGTGLSGATDAAGTKRAGENLIDYIENNVLYADFDDPIGTSPSSPNRFFGAGTSLPLDLEYLIAPGDSGGGLFIEDAGVTYIAGIHSFIGAYADDGVTDSSYGDVQGSTQVSSYADWIYDTIDYLTADNVSNSATVPNAPAWMLMAIGLLAMRSSWRGAAA